ncbi:MAG: hypothetical protein NC453_11410 [Muribaculum sp.]|nr:hypothetical protein [Muribaculum sp.]
MQAINFEQFKEIGGRILNGVLPDKPIVIIPDSYRAIAEIKGYKPDFAKGMEIPSDKDSSNRPVWTSKTNIPFVYVTDAPLEDRVDELTPKFEILCYKSESFHECDYYVNEVRDLYNKALEDIMDLLRRKGENNYVPFNEDVKCVSDIDMHDSDKEPVIITVTGAAYLPQGLQLHLKQEIDGYKWVYYAKYMNAMPLIYQLVAGNIDAAIPFKMAEGN